MEKKKALSTRIAAAILAASIGGAILLIGIFAGATAKGFLDIEKDLTASGLSRTRAILDHRVQAIGTIASDYARWHGFCSEIRGKHPSFVADFFAPNMLDFLSLDFVAIYGEDGALRDVAYGSPEKAPKYIPQALADDESAFARTTESRTDIMLLGGVPYAVASASESRTEGSSAFATRIVCGRAVDETFAAELAEPAGLGVRLLPYTQETSALPSIQRGLLKDPIIGRTVVSDASGKPVLIIETTEPRTVFLKGHRYFVAFIWVALGILLATFIGVWASVKILLIHPVEILERSLGAGQRAEVFHAELELMSGRDDIVGRTARIVLAADEGLKRSLEAERSATERLEEEVRSRTQEMAEAKAALEVYKRIMEETSEGIVVTDLEGKVLEANAAYCTISGYAKEELLGRNARMMKSGKHDAAFYQSMWDSILSTGRWEGEVWDKRKDGTIYPKWLSIDTIRDAEGVAERYVGISADISRMKEAEENLNRLAFYDSLTGLPNRALFADRFLQAITRAQRGHTRVALLYLDLDHFKDVNDGYGHHAGDELLCMAAERIAAQVREADTVCRIGGDEFTVILESIKKSEDAAAVARKIVETMSEPFKLQDTVVYVGASVGIALYPYDGITFEDLVKHADAAMYEAKENGRGQFRFASGGAGTTSRRRIEMEARLRKALEEGQFELHYQPQVSAGGAAEGSNAGLVGAEALARLRAEDGSLIGPEFFIETAEETGLIVPLGALVLREACMEAKRWLDSGHAIPVSVNISPRQFEHGIIVEQVATALEDSRLPGELLRLEVTESVFMRDGEHNAAIIRDLKKLGVTFSMDDFGVGYSSLRYIDILPIDSLKIDKSFVRGILSRYDGGDVATAVVVLARSFGLSSVAEGVETSGQLDAIRARGCDEVQGYFVSRPLDAESFREFLGGKLQAPPDDDEDDEEPGALEEVL